MFVIIFITSVVIIIEVSSFINGNKLIPILEEYQVPATLFLITGWWEVNNYKSNYLEVYSHGDELHHISYKSIEKFKEGLAVVEKNNKYGYTDKTGKEVIPCQYDKILFKDKNTIIVNSNDQILLININSERNYQLENNLKKLLTIFPEGFLYNQTTNTMKFIEETNEKVKRI